MAAADASPAMVELTRERLSELEGIRVIRCAWAELCSHFEPGSFDAVLCTGNSIAHSVDASEMIDALRSFRTVLAPGGCVIVDTHHWEALRVTDDRDRVDSVVVVRGGIRCARSLRWRFPDRFEAPHVLEISLEFTDGDRTWARSHEVTLNPFTAAQLRERVIAARLRLHSMDPRPDDDRYTAVVVRPGE